MKDLTGVYNFAIWKPLPGTILKKWNCAPELYSKWQIFPAPVSLLLKLRLTLAHLVLGGQAHRSQYIIPKEQLIGRQILGIINFPEKQVATFISQFLITGFADDNGDIVLAAIDNPVPNGSKLI